MQRKIEVGLGPKEIADPTIAKKTFEHKAKIVGDVVKDTAKVAVFGVCAFVVLDTVRQIAVEKFA